ncbi:MAG: dephospho-CoA kinase [Acholeplasmatales bacterium]|nr:dephospho-CoA kinase [Acholeplasmatales bacterium]
MKKVIGITGGISSGKSFVCNEIKNLGYPLIDCDKVNHDLLAPGNSIYLKVIEAFGTNYLNDDKTINRALLAELIFNDKSAKERLNNISHPLIMEEVKRQIDLHDGMVFVEVPLLFECKLEYMFDKIVCIYVDKNTQINRLMARDSIEYEYAAKKVESQLSLEIKKERSDYVIDSSKGFDDTYKQIQELIKVLKGEN